MDLEKRQTVIEEVLARTEERDPDQPYRRWLWTPPASGGTSFLRQLEEQMRGAGRAVIRLELPAYAFDAPEHVLAQLCQHLGRSSTRDLDPTRLLHTRVREIARPLGREGNAPVILVRLPMSWLGRLGPQHMVVDDARSVLRALFGSDLDAVVVSTQRPPWLVDLLGEGRQLEPLEAGDELLLDRDRWQGLLTHAARLRERLGASGAVQLPLDLQLGVACLAAGVGERLVSAAFEEAVPTDALIQLFATAVAGNPPWPAALRRISLPRFPIPEEIAVALAGDDARVREIVLHALASRSPDGVRFHEVLHALAGEVEGHGEPAANLRLAEHYRAHDSAPTSSEAVEHAVPWLERLHHLARSGRDGVVALRDTPVLSRMSRYELAWSLSVEYREYEAAASIYQRLVTENDKDAYSHHYWAWNLDQAGKEGPTVLREYQCAIDQEPANPWYHSRFITFLLDHGFEAGARTAFRRAMKAFAQAGVTQRDDLPLNFHTWVARAALDAGDLELAQQVLAAAGRDRIKALPLLRALRDELDVLLEVDRLGEALYPATVPVADRWKPASPQVLPPTLGRIVFDEELLGGALRPSPAPLVRFHPGRVLAIDEEGMVELVLADVTRSPPLLFAREISYADLTKLAGGDEPEVGRFLEFGVYEDGRQRVAYHPPSRYSGDREAFLRSLRYLRDASGEEES